MKVALNFRRAGYAACIASGMLAVFVAGCSTNSEVIVSDVEMGEEANLGEMTVADLLANGKYAEARGSSQSMDQTCVSCNSCIGRQIHHHCATYLLLYFCYIPTIFLFLQIFLHDKTHELSCL